MKIGEGQGERPDAAGGSRHCDFAASFPTLGARQGVLAFFFLLAGAGVIVLAIG